MDFYIDFMSYAFWAHCLVGRVFANGQGDLGSKTLKWYLIPPCLILSNIRYVSRVVEQTRERNSALPYASVR